MTDVAIKDPYIVKERDTLSAIAKACGKSASELRRLNQLSNPNRLDIGQTLYLSRETAFCFSVLFLDALRHPIENLSYKIKYDGLIKAGKTPANGLVPRLITKDAHSRIEIFVQDQHGQWVNVCNVTSDYGHKLTTLVSCIVVFKGATEKHPQNAPAKPESEHKPDSKSAASPDSHVQPAPPKPASGGPLKNNPDVKTKKTKGKHGQEIIEIGVDIPKEFQEHFAKYTGGEITETQWAETAETLQCEAAVLKAFAEVESGGRSSFWRLNKGDGAFVPATLYERHCFSRLTKQQYDRTHPDISWPAHYRKKSFLGKKDGKMPDGIVEPTDIYSDYSSSYLRLINAYRLNPDAALKSCSWGKFQILGENFALCGEKKLMNFVDKVCTSEAGQIELVAQFIQNKPPAWKNPKNRKLGREISLWEAVKTKNWAAIAFNYNGPDYKKYSYDTLLKAAYEKHCKQKT
jgi:LysM repeat protein